MEELATTSSEDKSKRLKIPSRSKWEDIVGYSRVVKTGNIVEVAGTTSVDDNGKVIGIGDPSIQTKYIFEKISQYLQKVGATLEDVVRTRMFVTDINQWEEIGKVHGEFFKTIKPVATMVEVNRLIDPDLLIEIEVTAILND